MMNLYRKPVDVASFQNEIKQTIQSTFKEFNILKLDNILGIEQTIYSKIEAILEILKDEKEENYYRAYFFLTKSIFQLIHWVEVEITDKSIDKQYLKTAQKNAQLAEKFIDNCEVQRPSIQKIKTLIQDILVCDDIFQVDVLLKKYSNIPLMLIYNVLTNPFENTFGKRNNFREDDIQENEISVVSALFYLDNELWANPQILQPNVAYSIFGQIKIDNWKPEYNLKLSSVSTTDDSWYILSFPQILTLEKGYFKIKGQIIFKYPQQFGDEPLAIKLLCAIQKSKNEIIYPTLIGYNQLKVKVLDNSNFPFPTGFNKLNQKVLELYQQLIKEISIDKKELNDFLILLSNILNYQGYCTKWSTYKKVEKLLENDFRDKIIEYLMPTLGEEVIKEPELAGGRVEILFRGIPVELKVEKKNGDRATLKKKYGQQPLTYASSTQKQLSILCILDLTNKKKLPQNLASENVFLITPKFHGFEDEAYKTNSRIVMIIIDGNTQNPSSYSKTIG